MEPSGLKKLSENIQEDRIECNSEQKPTKANNGKVVCINWIFYFKFFSLVRVSLLLFVVE